jgi:large subunit ribosomal protein L10
MLKSDKEQLVAELTDRLRETGTLLVADYRGLTVTEIDDLRTQLLQHGARFRVVKNTLTRRAAEAAGAEALLALLDGPTAIAFLESDGDPVAVAKALSDVARTGRVLVIRGGILDGAAISAEDVEQLAKLPPADVLRGQIVGALTGPLQVVGLFAAPMRDFVGVLDARIRQLEEAGETAEEPAPAAEASAEPTTAEDAEAAAEEPAPEPDQPAPEASAEPAAEEPAPESDDPAAEATEEPAEPKAEAESSEPPEEQTEEDT